MLGVSHFLNNFSPGLVSPLNEAIQRKEQYYYIANLLCFLLEVYPVGLYLSIRPDFRLSYVAPTISTSYPFSWLTLLCPSTTGRTKIMKWLRTGNFSECYVRVF